MRSFWMATSCLPRPLGLFTSATAISYPTHGEGSMKITDNKGIFPQLVCLKEGKEEREGERDGEREGERKRWERDRVRERGRKKQIYSEFKKNPACEPSYGVSSAFVQTAQRHKGRQTVSLGWRRARHLLVQTEGQRCRKLHSFRCRCSLLCSHRSSRESLHQPHTKHLLVNCSQALRRPAWARTTNLPFQTQLLPAYWYTSCFGSHFLSEKPEKAV